MRDAARGAAVTGARPGGGALRRGHARDLPGAGGAAAGVGRLERAGDRGGGRVDRLRRSGRPRVRAGAAAPHAQRRRGDRAGRRAPLPVGVDRRRRPRRHRRRAAGGRRAVELLDRVRRGADPEGLPAGRAGREPRARAAALPVRARVPEHRLAGRVVRVRGPLRGRHAGHPAGVPGGCSRGLGADARAAGHRSRRAAGRPARTRRGDRRPAHRAGVGQLVAGVRARRAEPGVAVAADGGRRRADRADLPRPPGDATRWPRSRAAGRTCARRCRRCRTSARAAG